MTELEAAAAREAAFRAKAEASARALEIAWRNAGLPSDPDVMPLVSGRGVHAGPHCSLLGRADVFDALAQVLTEYARFTGRLVYGGSCGVLARVLGEADVRPALPGDGVYVISRELNA